MISMSLFSVDAMYFVCSVFRRGSGAAGHDDELCMIHLGTFALSVTWSVALHDISKVPRPRSALVSYEVCLANTSTPQVSIQQHAADAA